MDPLRELLFRAGARYLTVRPDGLVLDSVLTPRVAARLLDHSGARTLYRGRRPQCRSLDGVTALNGTLCAHCPESKSCTPQVRVDLLIENRPFRLLLAFTSATNFLTYCLRLRNAGVDPATVTTQIVVVPRATWGELQFHQHRT